MPNERVNRVDDTSMRTISAKRSTFLMLESGVQLMPSDNATAAAPIVTGVLLAGTTTREMVQPGLELWMTLALAGGLSAVAVGLGVLTGFRGFDSRNDDDDGHRGWATVALAGLVLTCFTVGAGIALA
mgnify:CR=1 FL=1